MKGIILAGGHGSRLNPITLSTTKQLLPVYSKPLIHYPLSILMWAGIREILLITKPKDKERYYAALKDGKHLGLDISYVEQTEPRGISEAFILGKEFIGKDDVCLILGDNIIHGYDLQAVLSDAVQRIKQKKTEALIFGYPVNNPKDYGIAKFDKNLKVVSLEEKPKKPKTNCAVIGLYIYKNTVVEDVKKIIPSQRGELEITDLNKIYLNRGTLDFHYLGRGMAWFDTGTFETYYEAISYVRGIEKRQGMMISNIEEVAYRMGYISKKELDNLISVMPNNEYRYYLENKVINEGNSNV